MSARVPAFVAVAALVSYHLNPHDVAVLIVPILFGISRLAAGLRGTEGLLVLTAAAALYSPWTYLALGPGHLLGLAAPLAVVLALTRPTGARE